MPEGHTVHRLARTFTEHYVGRRVRVSSPQGRFSRGAALLDTRVMVGAEALGKHLLLGFEGGLFLHVHLGLYGSWVFAGDLEGTIGAPRRTRTLAEALEAATIAGSTVRVRLSVADGPAVQVPPEAGAAVPVGAGQPPAALPTGDRADQDPAAPQFPAPSASVSTTIADLTGPTACEVMNGEERAALIARLGPDPLRQDADPDRFVARVLRSRAPIGTQLMNQAVVAGVGNIYRAEALFRTGIAPSVPGTDLARGTLEWMWGDLVRLMTYGFRTGMIVTTEPADRRDAGDRFYVYHREKRRCRVCGATVRRADMAGRRVYWCPGCERPRARRRPWTAGTWWRDEGILQGSEKQGDSL